MFKTLETQCGALAFAYQHLHKQRIEKCFYFDAKLLEKRFKSERALS